MTINNDVEARKAMQEFSLLASNARFLSEEEFDRLDELGDALTEYTGGDEA